LCDPSTRKPLPSRDFGLVELGIVLHLSAPYQRQFKRVRAPLLHFDILLLILGNLLDDVSRKGDGGANERGCPPPGKGNTQGQVEVPGSSDFAYASGAILFVLPAQPVGWEPPSPLACRWRQPPPSLWPAKHQQQSLSSRWSSQVGIPATRNSRRWRWRSKSTG
jgi:hypothetical protein